MLLKYQKMWVKRYFDFMTNNNYFVHFKKVIPLLLNLPVKTKERSVYTACKIHLTFILHLLCISIVSIIKGTLTMH